MTSARFDSLLAEHPPVIEIAERIWRISAGSGIDRRNIYLIEQGDQTVLVNPGARGVFDSTRARIEQVLPLTRIRTIVCLQPDPGTSSALHLLMAALNREDAVVLAHAQTHDTLRHYGARLPVQAIDANNRHLQLHCGELDFIFTPYARTPGSVCAFEQRTGVLFSASLFGSSNLAAGAVAGTAEQLIGMSAYHQRVMPSTDALEHALLQIDRLPIRLIAPQQGALIPHPLVPAAVERLRHLRCGIDLVTDGQPDVERAWQLSDILRRITETMLLYRDFSDIAYQLQALIQPLLPAELIEYHAALPDGRILTLNPQTRFVGITDNQRPDLCCFIGKSRLDWLFAHGHDAALVDHQLHADGFCVQAAERSGTDSGRLVINLPLTARGQNRIEAFAVIHVSEPIAITRSVARLIRRISDPLQVALEREVMYRALDLERERVYQQAIRDPLTGLFTRVYMYDVISRQCELHDRDPSARLCVCLLDLDHFKQINDSHGHTAGDRALSAIASQLLLSCRSTDVAVRYGGEEILLFTFGQDIDGVGILADRLRDRIAEMAIDVGGPQPLRLTASIGVAEHRQGEGLEALIRRADSALYRAKRLGRNRVEVDE